MSRLPFWFGAAASLLLAIGLGGCARSSAGPEVEGVVKLDDKPLAGASVMLIPQGQNMGQTGFGKTDAAGKFVIASADGKTKGIAAGEYKVVISKHVNPDGSDYVAKPDEDPMLGKFKELLPAYANAETTKQTVSIPPEGKKDWTIPLSSQAR